MLGSWSLCQRDYISDRIRHRERTKRLEKLSPSDNSPIVFESEAMSAACSDPNNILQTRRHIGDRRKIPTPGDNTPICSQGQAVPVTGGQGNNIGGIYGNIGLASRVITPNNYFV